MVINEPCLYGCDNGFCNKRTSSPTKDHWVKAVVSTGYLGSSPSLYYAGITISRFMQDHPGNSLNVNRHYCSWGCAGGLGQFLEVSPSSSADIVIADLKDIK